MPSRIGTSSAYSLEVLDRGARLITAPLGERNSASLAMLFRVGSRYEDAARAGISHFIEHMLFKGSERYPSSKHVAEAIEGVGGELNAATDKELTVYWAKVPGQHLELAVDVLSDIIQAPRLEEQEFDREREVIIEEIHMYMDSPGDHVHSLFEEVLWPGHPLGVDIAGSEESLRGIGINDMREYMDEHYRARSLVVSVAGNVDHAETVDLLSSRLAGYSGGADPSFSSSSEPPPASNIRLLSKKTEQAHLVLGTRCVSYNHPDRFVIDIMNTILGEGMSSRLFLEVREKRGLCYDVHSWASKLADTGSAGVYVGCEPKRATEAVKAVMHELHRLAEEPIPEEEMTKAREYYKGRLLLHLEGTNSLATWLAGQEILTGRIIPVAEIVETVDAITAADVSRIARQTYAEQALQMAAIGPFKSESDLLQLISWN